MKCNEEMWASILDAENEDDAQKGIVSNYNVELRVACGVVCVFSLPSLPDGGLDPSQFVGHS